MSKSKLPSDGFKSTARLEQNMNGCHTYMLRSLSQRSSRLQHGGSQQLAEVSTTDAERAQRKQPGKIKLRWLMPA